MNIRIGNRVININNVTYIIDRQVYFNNGTSWVATEPEIQDLLAAMFNEPRIETVTVVEEPLLVKKPVLKKVKK